MAKRIVKCYYCNELFDANVEPFEKPNSTRYAHAACYQKHYSLKSQEEQDYETLIAYIKDLFKAPPNPRVYKQIKEFKDTYNYTYSGMYKTLKWWYEIKKKTIDEAHGAIGIIPYIYEDATKYYYAMFLASSVNEDKDIKACVTKAKEIIITPPKINRRPPKLFNLDFYDEEGEEE